MGLFSGLISNAGEVKKEALIPILLQNQAFSEG